MVVAFIGSGVSVGSATSVGAAKDCADNIRVTMVKEVNFLINDNALIEPPV